MRCCISSTTFIHSDSTNSSARCIASCVSSDLRNSTSRCKSWTRTASRHCDTCQLPPEVAADSDCSLSNAARASSAFLRLSSASNRVERTDAILSSTSAKSLDDVDASPLVRLSLSISAATMASTSRVFSAFVAKRSARSFFSFAAARDSSAFLRLSSASNRDERKAAILSSTSAKSLGDADASPLVIHSLSISAASMASPSRVFSALIATRSARSLSIDKSLE
mmetsp:Transcript_28271/g.51163  ORF Transcript_28271/g.51163 Transcript_28271/m.51163 type:complete len:224 (+) Transcript_28271:970-1641(+)